MLLIECGLVLVAIIVAFIDPTLGSQWLAALEHGFVRLARRRRVAVLVIGMAALATRAAMLPVLPIPEPVVHDEFGYLLAADTFAHGRMTNPTHPMWVHFETFSIIQKPTYQCFAQPAQGLILAAGKRIAGNPFWGVWLSAGILCATICWMLQAWLTPAWAMLGGWFAVVRFGIFSYWTNSYWGGAAGAIGGALVLGALPRIRRSQRIRDALVMGLGLAILANSRPFEGFVFALPVAAALFAWMFGSQRPPLPRTFPRVIVPLTLLLAVTAAGMGLYFWRVTGNPLHVPYQVERETYAVAPYFLWQSPRPEPVYHHEVIRRAYAEDDLGLYRFAGSPIGLTVMSLDKIARIWIFYLGPALTLPLVAAIFILPFGFSWKQISRRVRFLLLALLVFLLGLSLEVVLFAPHYAAPITCLLLALVLLSMRRLQVWRWRGRPVGLFLTRALPIIYMVLFLLRAFSGPLHIPLNESYAAAWNEQSPKDFGRAALEQQVQQVPGRHLVIVRYQPDHNPFVEWVYNEADIENANVVWARDMGPEQNQELFRYFKDRSVWLLEADASPARLHPEARGADGSTGETAGASR